MNDSRTFKFSGVTPSQNEINGVHWSKIHKIREEWKTVVFYTARRAPVLETRPMKVTIMRVSDRLIDDLNVPAGCKWLLDALVSLGWLVDDSHRWCRIFNDPTHGWQRKREKGEDPHMEVTLSPL